MAKYLCHHGHVILEMAETKVAQGWRIVIPKSIREKLGIEKGDKMEITMRGRDIVLRPKGAERNPLDKMYGSVKVAAEESPKKEARKWLEKEPEDS